MSRLNQHKQDKAERIIKQKRQREISNAWIQMAKVIKSLRVRHGVLDENIRY